MHLIAVDDQVSDRSFGVGTIHGNAKAIAAASRGIAAFKRLLNVMNIVSEQFDVGPGSNDADT